MAHSVCSTGRCQLKSLHVISTTAHQQRYGNPTRAVKFFCKQCQSTCDESAMAPTSMGLCPPALLPNPEESARVMHRFPAGSLTLIKRAIDFEAFERCVRRQPNGKAPGSDGQPREFCKHVPIASLELHWKAINAYLRGETPSVCEHEWAGAVAGYIPKKLSASCQLAGVRVATGCVHLHEVLSTPLDHS